MHKKLCNKTHKQAVTEEALYLVSGWGVLVWMLGSANLGEEAGAQRERERESEKRVRGFCEQP